LGCGGGGGEGLKKGFASYCTTQLPAKPRAPSLPVLYLNS
jgi:hypothetical protein